MIWTTQVMFVLFNQQYKYSLTLKEHGLIPTISNLLNVPPCLFSFLNSYIEYIKSHKQRIHLL